MNIGAYLFRLKFMANSRIERENKALEGQTAVNLTSRNDHFSSKRRAWYKAGVSSFDQRRLEKNIYACHLFHRNNLCLNFVLVNLTLGRPSYLL